MSFLSISRIYVFAALVITWPLVYFMGRFSIQSEIVQILPFKGGSNEPCLYSQRKVLSSCPCGESAIQTTDTHGTHVNKITSSISFDSHAAVTESLTPVTNIVFLKTHKTASSTVQNIIMRFGEKRDLIFALGAEKNLYQVGNFPAIFNSHHPLRSVGGKFNILCHHTRFSGHIKEVMHDGSIYFTILRNPVGAFESIFNYYNAWKIFKFENASEGIVKFLQKPKHYFTFPIPNVDAALRNPLLVDFGMEVSKSENTTAIYEKILELEEDFHFVMITEYFDESLILLRHLLNWSLEDIIYVRMNARPKNKVTLLGQEDIINMKKWNAGDQILYDHFNVTFWRKAKVFGLERLKNEVEELRKLNQYWKEVCFDDETSEKADGLAKLSETVSYKLSDQGSEYLICGRMALNEIQFTDMIYERMQQKGQVLGKRPPKWVGKK